MTTQIIFLISLPRSGSTVVQKLMATHKDVFTVPETWQCLRILGSRKHKIARSLYGHEQSCNASDALNLRHSSILKNLDLIYLHTLFDELSADAPYFLEKTPRNFYILQELEEIFPQAKFILLFRNPVCIILSYIAEFRHGRFNNIHEFFFDFKLGSKILSDFSSINNSNFSILRFQDFLKNPCDSLNNILEDRGLTYGGTNLDLFKEMTLDGHGDTSGQKKYKGKGIVNSKIDYSKVLDSLERILSLIFCASLFDKRYYHINDRSASRKGTIIDLTRNILSIRRVRLTEIFQLLLSILKSCFTQKIYSTK